MKKNQWLAIGTGVVLVAIIYFFGDRTPPSSKSSPGVQANTEAELGIDSILEHAKEKLSPEQITRLGILEQSVIRGDVKSQQLGVLHQLAHFWKDTARIFEPYAWYEAEAARLENSEKTLNFAAHLFLDDLRSENNPQMKKWKALQARDLFERSLKMNPKNDSTLIGLGAVYLFGNITENPMEGIQKIREVTERDSNNVFAHMMLGHGSIISGQYDRAISRFGKVVELQPTNLEAIMMLAEVYERKADKASAIKWYQKAVGIVNNPGLKAELLKRIEELSKGT